MQAVTPLLSLQERDPHCTCTWVPAVYQKDGRSLFTLKCRNSGCTAAGFHRRLSGGDRP